MGAGRTCQILCRRSLRRLQRLPAEAGGAVRQDRGKAYRRDIRSLGQTRRRVVRERAAIAERTAERDRRARAQGDPRAADLSHRCRAELPDPVALVGHFVRRWKPAHSPRLADRVLDIGPGAGMHGGNIVAQGTPADIMHSPASLTGKYLTGELSVAIPERRPPNHRRTIKVVNARGNNLKNVTAEIPLGLFTCVTGVSGGGKSTLLIDTLYRAIARKLNGASEGAAPHDRIEGLEHIDKIIDIDQSPIGRTPRSNPATYTGAFTPIREWFAGLPEAKARGYEPGRFSFNVKGGRCEACQGDGVIKIEMH